MDCLVEEEMWHVQRNASNLGALEKICVQGELESLLES